MCFSWKKLCWSLSSFLKAWFAFTYLLWRLLCLFWSVTLLEFSIGWGSAQLQWLTSAMPTPHLRKPPFCHLGVITNSFPVLVKLNKAALLSSYDCRENKWLGNALRSKAEFAGKDAVFYQASDQWWEQQESFCPLCDLLKSDSGAAARSPSWEQIPIHLTWLS